jgi:hypothetical protein
MLFINQVVERIISTHRIGLVYEDKMVWEGGKMVVIMSNPVTSLICILLSVVINTMWRVTGKKYWKSVHHIKVCHLFWCLCRGCLPTRCRLLERNVNCDIQCLSCEEAVEDDVHTFFTYVSARSSWQADKLSSVMVPVACHQGSPVERVFALCRK